MLVNKYLHPMFSALVIVALLNWIGGSAGYYETTKWYDWMMHFLGGVWAALFVLWAVRTRFFSSLKQYASPRNLVCAVVCIAFIWEIYELGFGLTAWADSGYVGDTLHDLLMGTLGASVIAFIFRNK